MIFNTFYKIQIDDAVYKLPDNINYIYGGLSTKDLDSDYKILFSTNRISQLPQFKLAEKYLNKILKKKYGYKVKNYNENICINNNKLFYKIFILYK